MMFTSPKMASALISISSPSMTAYRKSSVLSPKTATAPSRCTARQRPDRLLSPKTPTAQRVILSLIASVPSSLPKLGPVVVA